MLPSLIFLITHLLHILDLFVGDTCTFSSGHAVPWRQHGSFWLAVCVSQKRYAACDSVLMLPFDCKPAEWQVDGACWGSWLEECWSISAAISCQHQWLRGLQPPLSAAHPSLFISPPMSLLSVTLTLFLDWCKFPCSLASFWQLVVTCCPLNGTCLPLEGHADFIDWSCPRKHFRSDKDSAGGFANASFMTYSYCICHLLGVSFLRPFLFTFQLISCQLLWTFFLFDPVISLLWQVVQMACGGFREQDKSYGNFWQHSSNKHAKPENDKPDLL